MTTRGTSLVVWSSAAAFLLMVGHETRAAGGNAPPPVEARRPLPPIGEELYGPLDALTPVKPRTPEQQKQVDAVAKFMAGQLNQSKNKLLEAFKNYEEALELDPAAIPIYREFVSLAFLLGDSEKGLKYAERALKIQEDLQILIALADHLREAGRIDSSVIYLQRALHSKQLKRDSPMFVRLNLQLAATAVNLRRIDDAAGAFSVLLDARLNPGNYNLDFQTRAMLQQERIAQWDMMGRVLLAGNRASEAVRAFEEAVKAGGNKPGAIRYHLAFAHSKNKHFDKALQSLDEFFNAPTDGLGRQPYELLSEILKETGKSADLFGRIEKLAQKNQGDSDLQFFFADQLVAAGRVKDAEDLATRVLKESNDASGNVTLATIYRKQRRPGDLLGALAKGLKGASKEPQDAQRLDAELDEVQKDPALVEEMVGEGRKLAAGDTPTLDFFGAYILSRLAVRSGKPEPAVEFHRLAVKARRDSEDELSRELASQLLLSKHYALGEEVLSEALKGNRTNEQKMELMLLLSRVQELAGKTAAAIETMTQALKLDANNVELLFWDAWIYSHSRRWDEAIDRYKALMQKHADNARLIRQCQYSLSNCYVQKGDISSGEKILEEVLAKHPEDPSVNNDLGYLYADQGKNLEQAEKMIRKAIASEPGNPAYLDSLGWALFKLGRYDEALPYLEKAIEKPSGGDATIYDHLADCYLRLKKVDKAVEAWRKALKDAKDEAYPDARLLEQIEKKLKEHAPGDSK